MKELELKHVEAIEIVSEQKKEQTLLGRTRSFNDGRKFFYLHKGEVIEEPMKSKVNIPSNAVVVKALNKANAIKRFRKLGLYVEE